MAGSKSGFPVAGITKSPTVPEELVKELSLNVVGSMTFIVPFFLGSEGSEKVY